MPCLKIRPLACTIWFFICLQANLTKFIRTLLLLYKHLLLAWICRVRDNNHLKSSNLRQHESGCKGRPLTLAVDLFVWWKYRRRRVLIMDDLGQALHTFTLPKFFFSVKEALVPINYAQQTRTLPTTWTSSTKSLAKTHQSMKTSTLTSTKPEYCR